LFPKRGRFLCQFCWGLLEQDRSLPEPIFIDEAKLFTIWNWVPGKNEALSNYLLSLKAWSGGLEWKALAQELILQRQQWKLPIPKNLIIVPAPSYREGKNDHAIQLAIAVGFQLNSPVLPMLRKEHQKTVVHQRRKSKAQRLQIKAYRRENFSRIDLSEKSLILIDDVLTTGGTAKASLQALAPRKNTEIWCLAHRALL